MYTAKEGGHETVLFINIRIASSDSQWGNDCEIACSRSAATQCLIDTK